MNTFNRTQEKNETKREIYAQLIVSKDVELLQEPASIIITQVPARFRAWDKIKKQFFLPYITGDGKVLHMEYGNVCGTYDENTVVLIRYSGITTGQQPLDLCEGDVIQIRNSDRRYVVEFYAGAFYVSDVKKFNPKYEDDEDLEYHAMHGYLLSDVAFYVEYIGNIFQNPELVLK